MKTWNPSFERYRRIGQAVCRYFLEAPMPFTPSAQDYQQWLITLPTEERRYFQTLGFEACLSVNAFKQYWYEQQQYGLRRFLQQQLSEEDFKVYCQTPDISQFRGNLLKRSDDSLHMDSVN